MTPENENRTVTVGLVALPQTAPAVLYSLFEIFSSVGTVWEELTGKPGGAIRMQPGIVAERAGLNQCGMGAPVTADATFDSSSRYDVVIATDILLEPGLDPRGKWPGAAEWVRSQYDGGAIVGSVCTGGLLLADAGVLNDRQATTHWGAAPLFREFYPRVQLRPEKVLALAGPEHRIITAGGTSSWAEFALYLIARLCGQTEAIRSSKVFLLGDRNEGQLPFAAMTRPRIHSDAIIESCQTWIAEHYEIPNPVARMAEHSGLGTRTFKRRFQAATGYTPIEYVQTLRIEEAKQVLESTDMRTDEISSEVGYGDPASFRRLFKRMTGITPARYRQRFRRIATR
jgi:transcriptional regulator GlxA family with amidase domain